VWVERKLPHPLQTYAALYGSWVEKLARPGERAGAGPNAGRMIRLLAVDAALLAALIAGGTLALPSATRWAQLKLGLDGTVARAIVLAGTLALATPFCVGIMRVASRLGTAVADRVLPSPTPYAAHLAAAPRRTLELTLRFAIVLLVGVPLLAVTQPFLPGFEGPLLLALACGALGAAFWRSATDLEGHVRAGAQAIAEALAAQSHAKPEAALVDLHALLPGLGEPQPVEIEEGSGAAGRSLADLNLRGRTGATVIAIRRGAQGVVVPGALEVLRAGDVVALAGSREAIDAARVVLAEARAGE
jgi:CPA2 family monovalent cation:H+ antiporter-2